MSILGKAKELSKQEIISKVEAAKLQEFGVVQYSVAKRWEQIKSLEKDVRVITALNNSDTDGVLLDLVREEPENILDGIAITGYVLDASEMILMLPEYASDLKSDIDKMAKERGITIEIGIVDVRKYENDVLQHIVTAKHISDCIDGSFDESIYVSINGAKLSKFPKEKKIGELIEDENAKIILVGYEYFLVEEIKDKILQELAVQNGVVSVITKEQCLVQNLQQKLLNDRRQSCGKCVFCREGLIQLESMQKDMIEGKAKIEYLSLTEEIGEAMCSAGLCSMGKISAKKALSAINKLPKEFEEHIKKKNCPAGKCNSFVTLYIDPKLCTGCGACMEVCSKDCIEGKSGYIHMIDEFECSKCRACIAECEEGAILQVSGKLPKLPNRLTKVGKFKKH